jgi:transketolase
MDNFTADTTDKISAGLYEEIRGIVSGKPEATRATSGRCMQVIAKHMEGFVGGSADLGPSNKTFLNGYSSITSEDFKGKNIHFGIREHSMGAIINGMSLHGGLLPYASTFLIFSDYMRPSIRLSSLMNRQLVYVFTHDSIFVGEDGPTHQPIEQLSSLRLIPGLRVLRPCGERETIESWLMALEKKNGPTALILTRQNLEQIEVKEELVKDGIRKGAYVIAPESAKLKLVVLASGSEVPLALKAREKMNAAEWMRIVSVPCMELFMEQNKKYIDAVMPKDISRVSIEAGSTRLWKSLCGLDSLK